MAQEKSPDAAGLERREVTAVVPRSWPPQYSVDENGKPTGFAIDVMNEIAARAGLTVKYVIAGNFSVADDMLRRGDADLIPNSGIVSERLDSFAFTTPVETFAVSLFVRHDSNHINGAADLVGRTLGVVEKNIGMFMFEKRADMDVRVYPDIRSALFELVAGQVDALVYPQPVLLALARQIGIEDRIKRVGAPLREVRRGIRVMKSNVGLLAVLNRAVESFVGTPEYQQIYLKWYGRPTPFWTADRIAWAMGGLILVLLIAMAWWRHYSVLRLNRDLRITMTGREEIEKALREREEQYRDLIDGSLLAIQIVAQDGKRIYVNQAFVELLGYDHKDEVIALQVGTVTGRDAGSPISRLREVRTSGEQIPFHYEFDAHRKDGSTTPLQAFARPIVWEGEYAQQRTYIDLTERELAERALRDSEARYRELIEGSDLGIQIGTRDKGRAYANRACADLFGYGSPDQLLKIPAEGLIAEHDRRRVKKHTSDLFESTTTSVTYEFDGMRKDGSIIPVQAFARHITWQGEAAIQRTFIDLTHRKRAEEQLRQAQKMEAVGQLTGGVAHDFNNLLTVIHGNLELLSDRLEDTELSRLAQNAINASRRGGELTQRLLAFSRRQTLAPRVIDLDELIAGMTDLMRRTLGETIAIEMTADDHLWRCEADPGQLENAILNLALNARDAMLQGGRLTIKTANVSLDDPYVASRHEVLPGEYVMVSIADTGTGMTRKVADRAFEPFFTTKDVGQGSGLGLSMVHGFINQSNGYVTIDSAVGTGTTVKMFLPRLRGTCQPARQGADPKQPVSHGERVLVVEDDPDVRDLTVNMFTDLGYDTVEAADGKQALEILQRTPVIDLLFTDVVLPGGMSGADIAREASRQFPDIKILFTSGYADNVLAQFGQTDAGVHLINKPFRKHDLARQVRVALNQPPA